MALEPHDTTSIGEFFVPGNIKMSAFVTGDHSPKVLPQTLSLPNNQAFHNI